jgi:aminopeptidase N
MRKTLFLFAVLLSCQFAFSQYYNPRIGDTISTIHYSIHLTEIDTDDETIDGYAEITLSPDLNGLDYIALELKDLTVDSVFIDGSSRPFSHVNDIIRISGGKAYSIDDTLMVKVHYNGNPFHEAWGGFHFSGDYAFNLGVGFVSIPHNLGKTWFPCVDDFTDRATYDFHVTVENDKKAICGGMLQDTIDNGDGTKTWIWQLNHRVPTYLASVAVGDYVLYEDEYMGLEDTVPVQIYTRPSEASKVEGSFTHLKQILEWFETRFGAYPFGRVGYTGTAIGAMEHATNIAYPHFAINGGTTYESLLTHELSHMWFGDRVTCSSAEDMWLNEGWATFCEIYYLEELYSYDQYLSTMRTEHREVLRKTHINDDGYYALDNIPQEYTYGEHAYNKGATVANSLRGYLGDSLFYEAITAYLDHFAYQSVSSADMRDFLTGYTGIDMSGFFDAWVSTPGTPHFSVDSVKVSEENRAYKVEIWTRNQHKGAEHVANGNLIEMTFADTQFNLYSDTVGWSGVNGYAVKYLDFEPIAWYVDLYEKLNDATTDNYRFFNEPENYSYPDTYFALNIEQLEDSTLLQVTHHWVAPDSLKVPVDGLTLSDYRHWEVNGFMPESMMAGGRFTYDRGGYLDNGLIQSESDSVVMLYRAGAWEDWQEVEQTRTGTWNFGYIDVDELKIGEYTLAVWDKYLVGNAEVPQQEEVRIYPNPSRGVLNFEFREKDRYLIQLYDVKGALLDEFHISSKKKTWKWRGQEAFTGTVFVHVYRGKKMLTVKKMIFTK